MSENVFWETMKNYSDRRFLKMLCRAETEPVINGLQMPGFPDAKYQKESVGSSGSRTLRKEGWMFYKLVKKCAQQSGNAVGPDTRILDFGCGWGRMTRFYFKDIKSENIFGIDVDPTMIKICQDALHCGNYSTVDPLPPPKGSFPDHSFHIIIAYSVFSHLHYDAAERWVAEFSRILKPGGILVATTQGERFLKLCKRLQNNPNKQITQWHQSVASAFENIDDCLSRYRSGEFLYAATGGGYARDASFYGEAIVPKEYIEKHFGKYLELVDFFHNARRLPWKLPQACFVMQKNESFPLAKEAEA